MLRRPPRSTRPATPCPYTTLFRSAARRREPTGSPIGFFSDVVATAKRDIRAGEMLDGEGGYCVWGKQTPADDSLRNGYLPLGLAHNVKLKRDVAKGERLAWADVEVDETSQAVKVRRAREARYARAKQKADGRGEADS